MRGFSLVELSIVLVILGLLTGGILAGQSIIRAAELRSVSSEFQRFQTAQHTFRDKYFAIPGDFQSATRFWGRQTNTADCTTNSSAAVAAPGACDGDGDGLAVTPGPAASQSGERFQYWRQLALAGLIEGSYTGQAGASGVGYVEPGANAPRAKLGNAAWAEIGSGSLSGNVNYYDGNYGNAFFFGAPGGATPQGVVLKPEEAWNIDTKLDDGRPAYGNVVVYKPAFHANCSDDAAAATADYILTYASAGCAFIFKNP